MEGYDVAQICQNGHVANSSTQHLPEFNQIYCEQCGSATITTCQGCGAPIRGSYWGSMSLTYSAPSFCINCGEPFPWTKLKLQAAQELANEVDSISEEDKVVLKKSIDDLIKESPSTPVAATRFKKIMAKMGQTTAGMFREILIDVLSEAAKRAVFPS